MLVKDDDGAGLVLAPKLGAVDAAGIPLEALAVCLAAMLAMTATAERRTFSNCRYSGMASATVAGPSRKWTNCAPSK